MLLKIQLERKLFGITFKNPVGLAAGFDKMENTSKNYLTLDLAS